MTNPRKKIEQARELLKPPHRRKKPVKILLGHESGKQFYWQGEDLENSIHIMGATREGKSKQLQNIFRQFIVQGVGCALIDPHGYLYDDLVADCSYLSARHPEILDRIILFDPGDNEYTVGFNPMQPLPEHDLATLVLSRMYATIKARGKDNFDEMPTAKTWLQNIFTPLVQKGLTLMEARYLIDRGMKTDAIARTIVEGTGIDLIEHDWSWYAKQSKRTQYEELLSSVNMLRNFVTSERMELIFGRQRNVIDLRKIMDEGKILLVNLSSRRLHKDIARLLGTLLVNEFFLAAKIRPEHSRPFYLAIDEFENYVTQDIGDILDQGAKFKLYLLLAHHSLAQVQEENKKVCTAVMQNAKIKLIYGGLTYQDAETMVKEMYSYHEHGGLDPMEVKHITESPYIEPHETTRGIHADAHSEADFSASGENSGYAFQSGETTVPVDSLFMSEEVRNLAKSHSDQMTRSSSRGSSSGHSYTDTVVPFIEQQLKWYISNVQYMPLDEQIYRLVARMKNLPQQVCLIKLPKNPVATIRTSYVKEYPRLEDEEKKFALRVNRTSPNHMTLSDSKKERQRITNDLVNKKSSQYDQSDDDNDRWQ